MASIHKELEIDVRVDRAWDALRDVGALHTRLCPHFVVDTRLEEGARVITLTNGMTSRELIVDVDDERRRVAWAIVGSPQLTHHNGSAQVFGLDNGRTRFVWIADVLPHVAAPAIDELMEQGIRDIKATLESRP
jgi:hypothetical protein